MKRVKILQVIGAMRIPDRPTVPDENFKHPYARRADCAGRHNGVGVKAGTCKVTVTVTPKKGRATSKTVTLQVTK